MNPVQVCSNIQNEEIENLINSSKNYINKKIDPNLELTLDKMIKKVELALAESKENMGFESFVHLMLLKKVLNKFHKANDLLQKLRSNNIYFEEIDTISELDILLNNLKSILNTKAESIDTDKLEKDIETIEDLEDQKKRILMTYLMSDWKNMESVLDLMKLGETYRDIADELLNISMLKN